PTCCAYSDSSSLSRCGDSPSPKASNPKPQPTNPRRKSALLRKPSKQSPRLPPPTSPWSVSCPWPPSTCKATAQASPSSASPSVCTSPECTHSLHYSACSQTNSAATSPFIPASP